MKIFVKENTEMYYFMVSKKGLSEISISDSRENCDFGKGFYLGRHIITLSFV